MERRNYLRCTQSNCRKINLVAAYSFQDYGITEPRLDQGANFELGPRLHNADCDSSNIEESCVRSHWLILLRSPLSLVLRWAGSLKIRKLKTNKKQKTNKQTLFTNKKQQFSIHTHELKIQTEDKTCPVQCQRKAALQALAWSAQRSLCEQRFRGILSLSKNRRIR